MWFEKLMDVYMCREGPKAYWRRGMPRWAFEIRVGHNNKKMFKVRNKETQ
jgi:hypothetical protein